VAKSRNNLLGVGGQRKKLSRAQQRGNVPSSTDRKTADDLKQDLVRKMRERTGQPEPAGADPDATAESTGTTAPQD
jgi:hypothetical protein